MKIANHTNEPHTFLVQHWLLSAMEQALLLPLALYLSFVDGQRSLAAHGHQKKEP